MGYEVAVCMDTLTTCVACTALEIFGLVLTLTKLKYIYYIFI